jgi:hypothetical protein
MEYLCPEGAEDADGHYNIERWLCWLPAAGWLPMLVLEAHGLGQKN